MIEVDDQQLEAMDGGEGGFWSPWYAVSYAVGYVVGAYVRASIDCSCDPSLGMT
jgi:hypothetical protein